MIAKILIKLNRKSKINEQLLLNKMQKSKSEDQEKLSDLMNDENYNQHYVPHSILKNFKREGSPLFCLRRDKNGHIKGTSIKRLCAQKGFYSFTVVSDKDKNISRKLNYDQKAFTKLDNKIAPIIKNLLDSHSVDVLTNDDKKSLAKYDEFEQWFEWLN
ncbi:DUF4238 domain-containing protein [Planktothrix mougeotii]|uniref:DUF4238 domain-containing protein n=1 Tax=Planktothrix mougeotii LEGE 06226 TaxID=1828728 RepID=A0ABR9U9X2_9CYAN|nr:DUF4238 domain-containing protein [Planktothrix mougeotii]MBE9143222.1 DUF4238 domain-containing protein [Planktothrix mougeotii LEGE 06226]